MVTHIINEKTTRKVEIEVNDFIVVELDEIPTSGYLWVITFINKEDIKLVSERNEDYAGGGIGGGRKKIFEFQVLKKESGHVKLENIQKWSRDRYKTFEFSYS